MFVYWYHHHHHQSSMDEHSGTINFDRHTIVFHGIYYSFSFSLPVYIILIEYICGVCVRVCENVNKGIGILFIWWWWYLHQRFWKKNSELKKRKEKKRIFHWKSEFISVSLAEISSFDLIFFDFSLHLINSKYLIKRLFFFSG